MSGFLLDVNVLIALAWPSHVAHDRVHRWFAKNSKTGWATCPMTECAFVRIISNPSFSAHALRPGDSMALLRANLSHPAHSFWADDLNAVEALQTSAITGHQQITDAYLLALASRHRGKLVTLDSALASLAEKGSTALEIIR
jgi:uncharacterized protein